MDSYTYNQYDKSKNVLQPQLIRFRQRYRGPRDSHKENLEQDSFLQDAAKLSKRIINSENIVKTMVSSFYYHNSATPITPVSQPFFTAEVGSYRADLSTPSFQQATLLIEDMIELSSTLFKILAKIKRLENQEK